VVRVASLRYLDHPSLLVEVVLETGETARIHERRLTGSHLLAGVELGEDGAAQLARWAAEDGAERRALRLMARRDRSRAELERRLGDWGLDEDSTAAVLERLTACGAVDDTALAAAMAEHSRDRGHGRLRLQADMRRLAVDPEAADTALARDGGAEQELARAHREIERRFHGRPRDRQQLARAAAHLTRRGFDPDTVAEALGLEPDG
jgi:regulatory protein